MSTMGALQRKIEKVERFQVRFKHLRDGRDVNDNMRGLPPYPFSIMAKNAWTVAYWKSERIRKKYPGFRVEVLFHGGKVCDGRCLLGNVRDSYLES